ACQDRAAEPKQAARHSKSAAAARLRGIDPACPWRRFDDSKVDEVGLSPCVCTRMCPSRLPRMPGLPGMDMPPRGTRCDMGPTLDIASDHLSGCCPWIGNLASE